MGNAAGAGENVGLNPTIDFIAGCISGIVGLIVGHPFDTVKVRFQSPTIATKYRSTVHAFSTIIREERLVGLCKGIASPLITAALLNGLVFASYRFFLKIQNGNSVAIPTLTQVFLAGTCTGVVCSLVTTPTELIKIRQQDQLVPTSAKQIALQIAKESGIPGLYRGFSATILRETGYGAYFGAYEATCRYFSGNGARDSPWFAPMLAGGVAGIVSWAVVFPLDVVKTRMQGTPQGYSALRIHTPDTPRWVPSQPLTHATPAINPEPIIDPYRSLTTTIVNSYRAEGMGVFFRGLAPTVIR
ncbi:hypothetical protein AX15_000795 [Amanita polypyramis BW_CC]|nr:hypothetical protein AX15_000795 [Amanita polypyramis BW_CC]